MVLFHLPLPQARPHLGILWIDGVGAYLLAQAPSLTMGQAIGGNDVDLPIRGGLSRRAAQLQKWGEDYFLSVLGEAASAAPVQGGIEGLMLRDEDRFKLGSVELKFSRPSPLSTTARLEILGSQSWNPRVDAVILLGGNCVIGPEARSHIRCPEWSGSLTLYRNPNESAEEEWICRPPREMVVRVDGVETRAPFPFRPGQRIVGDDFSVFLE